MNEIEVKAKLNNREKVLEHLKNSGAEIIGAKYQKDTVFWPNDIKTAKEHKVGVNYLRIREQDSNGKRKVMFTLKQNITNQMDCKEIEFEILENTIPQMIEIMTMMGYYEFAIVEKERTTAKLGDIEICLDDVTGLGSFIELEKFGESEKAVEIQNELYGILKSWGIDEGDHVQDGYDILMFNKKNNI